MSFVALPRMMNLYFFCVHSIIEMQFKKNPVWLNSATNWYACTYIYWYIYDIAFFPSLSCMQIFTDRFLYIDSCYCVSDFLDVLCEWWYQLGRNFETPWLDWTDAQILNPLSVNIQSFPCFGGLSKGSSGKAALKMTQDAAAWFKRILVMI